MKITYYNKTVRATAESLEDIKTLLALGNTVKPQATPTKPKTKFIETRRRKHKKLCEICGKKYKGLTMHKRMKHDKIISPVTI